ncbi:hypothetical protein JZ751_007928 [Albula glossodonta]|uniref:Secreted protein n=1 Tax=Albula glossodonta TaxID=121402 RepID=A0A8T2P2Z8_9TELE|nr:hypothetical protein JZ751_007928 [Albula glossodonta]
MGMVLVSVFVGTLTLVRIGTIRAHGGVDAVCSYPISISCTCCLQLVQLALPSVVWRLQSGPSGISAFNRSKHSRR